MLSKTVFCPRSVAINDITAHSISYPRKHPPLHFLPLRATFDYRAKFISLFLNISGLIPFFRLHMCSILDQMALIFYGLLPCLLSFIYGCP